MKVPSPVMPSAPVHTIPILDIQDLHKIYPGEKPVHALQGVNLQLFPGEQVAIVGASGAGKSTLLHILGALDRPTRGVVRFQGRDLFREGERTLARFRNETVGFVFQFHHLLPEFTALENLLLPLMMRGPLGSEEQKQARDLLESVGLGERLHHLPGELSGGEQQRVAVARALITRPRVVLADEPTGNLDSRTGEQVFQVLTHLCQAFGATLVVVTHNEALARRLGRVLRMQDGRIVEESPGGVPPLAGSGHPENR